MPVTKKYVCQQVFVDEFLETGLLDKITWNCDRDHDYTETLEMDNNCKWTIKKMMWHDSGHVELGINFSNLDWLFKNKPKTNKEYYRLKINKHMYVNLNTSLIPVPKSSIPKNTIIKNNLIFSDINLNSIVHY
jgi:hypothetical protein